MQSSALPPADLPYLVGALDVDLAHHLSVGPSRLTMCGLRNAEAPRSGAASAAMCATCLRLALQEGHTVALLRDNAYVNLTRLTLR